MHPPTAALRRYSSALCALLVAILAATSALPAGELPASKEPAAPQATPPAGSPAPAGSQPAPAGQGERPAATDISPGTAPGSAAEGETIELRLSLKEAIRLTLENNLQLQISRLDDHIRQREVIIAKAVFDPFFNLGATYAKNRDPTVSVLDLGGIGGPTTAEIGLNPSERTSYSVGLAGDWILGTRYNVELSQVQFDRPATSAGGILLINPTTSTQASVDIRQPLMLGAWYGVNTAEIRIAHNNLLISREELERITMDTVFNLEQAYWEMAFASRNLEAKVKALAVTQENLDNTRKKEQVGTLAAIAVTTAESQVALRKAELEDARLIAAAARDRLLNVLNYPGKQSLRERWEANKKLGPYDFINVVCTTLPAPATLPFDRDRALSEAFSRRPEYRQIALNRQNQEIRVEVAQNALLPRLDALGRWAQLGLEETFDKSFSQLNSGRYYDWLVGIEFSVPLSNRAARSRYRNARDELRKLKLLMKDLENQIVLEVDNAFRRVTSFQRKVADLEDRVRLQIEILQAERRKLEVGRSIPYTVSTIENDLVDNQTQSLRAKADLQTAIAEFFRVTGTLLEQYGIEIGPP